MKIITEQEQSIMDKILEAKQTSKEVLLHQTKFEQEVKIQNNY
jgi:F0F1-type ATP synthase membrane subunit b/b'